MHSIEPERLALWSKPTFTLMPDGGRLVTRVAALTPELLSARSSNFNHMSYLGVSLTRQGGRWVALWQYPEDKPRGAAPGPESITIPDWVAHKLKSWQPKQSQLLAHGLMRYPGALDASGTGVGKTAISLAACAALNLRPLVVCPKPIVTDWHWMSNHLGVPTYGIINWEKLRTGKTPYGKWTTKKKLVLAMPKWQDQCVIWDEVHMAKGGMATQNGRMAISARRAGIKCIGLSATASRNPAEMEALAYMLDLIDRPEEFRVWALGRGCSPSTFKPGTLWFPKTGGEVYMRQIHREVFGTGRGVRIMPEDIPDFPESIIFPTAVDCGEDTAKIAGAYKEIADLLKAVERSLVSAKDARVQILRLRQKLELFKVPTILELMDEHNENGYSVVVFVNFRDTALTLAREGKANIIIGGQTKTVRDQHIGEFQINKANRIVATLPAGGVGVNLQDLHGVPRVSLLCTGYDARLTLQALGRLPRAGSKSKALQYLLFAAGTIEVDVFETCRANLQGINQFNDGDLVPPSLRGLVDHQMTSVDDTTG